jgi:hypothetical protein
MDTNTEPAENGVKTGQQAEREETYDPQEYDLQGDIENE